MKIDSKGYREFTLDNGLFVALQNTPTQTISGRLRVHQGAFHEQPGEEGLTHFLEHVIVTAGSRKYTPQAMLDTMDNIGYINAATSASETIFPIDMLAEDVGIYLDLIADVVAYPLYNPAKVDEERQRILREIADIKSSPDYQDNRIFSAALFGENSPHNQLIFGKESIVAKATPEDLQKIHGRGYHAANMDLILAGGLPENIEELVAEKFRGLFKGENQKYVFPRNRALEERRVIHNSAPELLNKENPSASTAIVYMGFPVCAYGDQDYYAVNMLAHILCTASSSYLFNKLSTRMGLAYDISGDYNTSNNKGLLTICGKIDASRIEQAIRAIFEGMGELQERPLPKEYLKRLVGKTKFLLAKTFETNSGHIRVIEQKIDYELTPETYFKEIEGVTPEQVFEAARKYLPAPDGKYVLLLRDPLKR